MTKELYIFLKRQLHEGRSEFKLVASQLDAGIAISIHAEAGDEFHEILSNCVRHVYQAERDSRSQAGKMKCVVCGAVQK